MTVPNPSPMTGKDWFAVGVKLIGLSSVYVALQNLLYFIDAKTELSSGGFLAASDDSQPIGYLLYVLGYGAFGVFLLRGTDRIIQFAYPPKPDLEEEPEGDHSTTPREPE